MSELSGKVALITGAGRGFGLAIAHRFQEAGADLVLNYRQSEGSCLKIVEAASSAGQRAIAIQADLADPEAIERMVGQAIDAMGQVDILVNNAGILVRVPFTETSSVTWRAEIDVNILGTLHLTHALLPGMIERRYGKIVNLSSPSALTGGVNTAVYAGTKGFILSWTKTLAREVGQFNINVNAIAPGSIPTDMNTAVYPTEEALQRKAAGLPLRRMGKPVDVAECALFLAAESSNFLTGQLLGPNGGGTM